MKKITLFLMSLFLTIGIMNVNAAQYDAVELSNGSRYTIEAVNGGFAYYDSAKEGWLIKKSVLNIDDSLFTITKGENGFYTIQTSDGKYVIYTGTSGDNIKVAATATEENKWWAIREGNQSGYVTIVPSTNAGNDVDGWNFANHKINGQNGAVAFYNCNNIGSQWRIVARPIMISEGTAKIKLNGEYVSSNGTALVKANNENSIFTITQGDNGYYTIKTADNKFVTYNTTGNGQNAIDLHDEANATDNNKWWAIIWYNSVNASRVEIVPSNGSSYTNNSASWNWARNVTGNNTGVGLWNDANSSYCEIEWSGVDVVYSFKYNGEEKYKQTVNILSGNDYPDFTIEFPFGVYCNEAKPAGVVEGAVTKDFNLTVSLPFEYANDYKSITKWYYMYINPNITSYLYYQPGVDCIQVPNNQVPANEKDAYTWAFIGDPFSGFTVVNLLAGENMILSAPGKATSNQQHLPRMVDRSSLTEDHNIVWNLTQGYDDYSNKIEDGFFMAYPGGMRVNRQSVDGVQTLCYWSGANSGSTFKIEERNDRAELDELIAVAEQKYTTASTSVGTTTGYIDATTLATLYTAIENAKASDDVITATADIQKAMAGVKTIMPEEGKLYRLYNPIRKTYVYSNEDNRIYHAFGAKGKSTTIWSFEKNSDGSFKMYNVHNGQYFKQTGWQVASYLGDNADCKVTIENQLIGNNYVFMRGNGNELHAQGNENGELVHYNTNATNNASSWIIEEVTEFSHTLNVGASGWATLVLGFNATIPTNEGFKAYTIKEIDGESVKLIEATGVLSANTPIIINAPQGDYTFEYTTGDATVTANGKLKGTLYNKNVTEDAYVLTADADDANGVCFGLATKNQADGSAFKNNANKAYLPVASGQALSASLRFDFGGTTGIEEVEIRNEKEEIYDLTGRRVNEITKAGVYIVNGRKILVK